jgi:hypothetical protein
MHNFYGLRKFLPKIRNFSSARKFWKIRITKFSRLMRVFECNLTVMTYAFGNTAAFAHRSARYLKIDFSNPNFWTFISEIELLAL